MVRKRQYYSAFVTDAVGCKFNKIMTEDVKVLIAEAFLSL